MWKAARASGAAPSFFRPETNFVDGGILANNPSLALLTEIAEFNVAKKALDHDEEVVRPYVMLSLGTGVPPVKKTNVVDIFRPDNVQERPILSLLFYHGFLFSTLARPGCVRQSECLVYVYH